MKVLQAPVLALAALLSACSFGSTTDDPIGLVRSLPYLEGGAPDLGPGKPVVVEFWATWCPPCVASTPHLVAIHERLAEEGLTIVGVHHAKGADDERAIRRFAETYEVGYSIARDESGRAGRAFGVSGIPHAFVYDKTGKLVWDGHPMDPEFEAAVDQVVGG
jgi:thiol-disulfide isomerase/thioredoxin